MANESLADQARLSDERFRRATWRLIPFLVFLFVLAWLDRVNVGFTKLAMLSDLKFSQAVHGLGAGIFGLAATGALIGSALAAFVALTVAAVGILAAFAVFWSMPQTFLAGTAAAGGIAVINSIGNLAGFVAPYTIGLSTQLTGSSASGLYVAVH